LRGFETARSILRCRLCFLRISLIVIECWLHVLHCSYISFCTRCATVNIWVDWLVVGRLDGFNVGAWVHGRMVDIGGGVHMGWFVVCNFH